MEAGMQILYITGATEDYLADSVFHGLRSLLGQQVVDYPKAEVMYRTCPGTTARQVRGRGFTLYSGLLDDIEIDRYGVFDKVRGGQFDLVIFSSIWRQFGLFLQLLPWLRPGQAIVLDGEDSPHVYPAAGHWWRRAYYWGLPRAHSRFLYFKREWTEQSRFSLAARLLPAKLAGRLPFARNLRPISFSIPAEKVVASPPDKTKDFPAHIVDAEVAAAVGGRTSYAFADEAAYYADLQASRFGVTTKRSGWDCLRHYEIAMNGAVPCFRNLDHKPTTCAPHGLDATNSISYRNWEDLRSQTSALSESRYRELQFGAIAWANAHTTVAIANRLLAACQPLPVVS